MLLLSGASYAQQPAPKKKVPTLTTDDIVRPRAEQPAEEGEAGATAKPADAKGEPKAGEGVKTPVSDTKVSPEESAWRERVKQARDVAKSAERAAEEGELRVTELRNQLGRSGQRAQDRNAIASDLDDAGRQLNELRAQARAAKADLEKLVEYGREKGYAEAAEPENTSTDGKPDDQFYRAKYDKLNEKLRDAERQMALYENRVRDLNQRIQNNSRTGDNFYIGQLQQERDDAQQKLDEAAAARSQAESDIENLLEEARRAGVSPGVFR